MGICHSKNKITPEPFKPKNTLQKLVHSYPNKPWSIEALSSNQNIDVAFIQAHEDIKWNIRYLALNPSITISYILSYANYDWPWDLLSINPGIPIKEILKYQKYPWDWYSVSRNPSVTINDILNNLNINWDFNFLSQNLPLPDILKYPTLNWNMTIVDHRIKVLNFKFGKVDISLLDYNLINANFKIKYILENLQSYLYFSNYRWSELSASPGILISEILQTMKLCKWNSGIFSNPNLQISEIDKLPFQIDYQTLSKNPNLSYNYISKNIDKDWCWLSLSLNRFNYDFYRRRNMVKMLQHRYLKNKYLKLRKLMDTKITKDLVNLIFNYI